MRALAFVLSLFLVLGDDISVGEDACDGVRNACFGVGQLVHRSVRMWSKYDNRKCTKEEVKS